MRVSLKWASVVVAAVLGGVVSAGAMAQSQSPTFVSLGTASVTGVYYPAGGAICRLVNKSRDEFGVRCSVESTAGSIYNLQAVRSGELDFAIVQSDWQYYAYRGQNEHFQDLGADRDLRAVFALHAEPFTVVARKDAKITRFEDLKGRRVNIGNPGSGQRGTMDVLMKAMGWDVSAFKRVSELRASEQARALCEDKIDAMVYVVGHPSGAVKEATIACDAVLVQVDNPAVQTLIESHPYYRRVTIPGGIYGGTDQDVNTFGVGATLVTSASVSEDVVYALVKSVFDNFDSFQRLHPAFSGLTKESMVKDSLTAPLHPGALKYYREVGLVK